MKTLAKIIMRLIFGHPLSEIEARQKLRQYLPPVPQQSLDTLQKITADLSNIAEKANKREKFLAKIR